MPGKNGNGKNGNGKKNGGKKGNGDNGHDGNGEVNNDNNRWKPPQGIGLEDYIRIFQVNIISSENSKTHRKDQGAPKIQALAKPA